MNSIRRPSYDLLTELQAYIMDLNPDKEIAINVKLLDRAITAIEHLAPNLKFVVLPTGTKVYSSIRGALNPIYEQM